MGTIDETMTPMLEVAHDVPLGTVARPLWRGRLHVHALVAVVPALAVLLTEAHGTRGRIAVAVYAIGLCSMFVASATYHRWVHTLVARDLWRRIDHAMIFAAIAGIAMKIVGWRHQRIVGGSCTSRRGRPPRRRVGHRDLTRRAPTVERVGLQVTVDAIALGEPMTTGG